MIPSSNETLIPNDIQLLKKAVEIGDELLKMAKTDKNGKFWLTTNGKVTGILSEDLYGGSTGIAYYLCELYKTTGDERYLKYATAAANWIIEYTKQNPTPQSYAFYPGQQYGSCFFLIGKSQKIMTYSSTSVKQTHIF